MTGPTKRSTWRAVIVVAVICASLILGLYVWRFFLVVRDPMGTFGGTVLTFEIDGDHPYDSGLSGAEAVSRTAEAIRNRAEHLAKLARSHPRGRQIDVEIPAIDGQPTAWLIHMLSRSGRIDFKIVDDGAAFMSQAVSRFRNEPGITAGTDGWTVHASGDQHSDSYLASGDAEKLDALVAKIAVPSDHEIALGDDDGEHQERTYYLFHASEVNGDRITDAEVNWDEQTGRPEVSLTFDKAGARKFEELTARSIGRKLAILVEGLVSAAPVIESKISGGHARITYSHGGDPKAMQQEAKDLIAVLRVGSLAAPVRLIATRQVPIKHR